MKKLIFSTVIALVMVISGVAGVSAFEAHQVDINAHVENAIGVSTDNLDLGTAFPEQTITQDVEFGLSESYLKQTTYSTVNYNLYWQLKPADEVPGVIPEPQITVGDNKYYEPLNPFLNVTLKNGTGTVDESTVNEAPTTADPVQFASGYLFDSITDGVVTPVVKSNEIVQMAFNAPAFQGYYDNTTDQGLAPGWTYGMLNDGQFVNNQEKLSDGTPVTVPNADLGINMIIQVTGFIKHSTSP